MQSGTEHCHMLELTPLGLWTLGAQFRARKMLCFYALGPVILRSGTRQTCAAVKVKTFNVSCGCKGQQPESGKRKLWLPCFGRKDPKARPLVCGISHVGAALCYVSEVPSTNPQGRKSSEHWWHIPYPGIIPIWYMDHKPIRGVILSQGPTYRTFGSLGRFDGAASPFAQRSLRLKSRPPPTNSYVVETRYQWNICRYICIWKLTGILTKGLLGCRCGA